MTRQRVTTRVITLLVVILVLLGLWQTGSGVWIYVKAKLAQVLLQRAWAGTLAGQRDVKPWPWADTWPVARLVAPSLGIDQIVLAGAYGRTLAFGPGRLESSSSAKDGGTMILTGHRDTHFQFLEKLHGGETLLVQTRAGRWHRFTVRDGQIVDSRTTSIRTDEGGRHLILITCYPFRTLTPNQPFRYVITADRESIADDVREED